MGAQADRHVETERDGAGDYYTTESGQYLELSYTIVSSLFTVLLFAVYGLRSCLVYNKSCFLIYSCKVVIYYFTQHLPICVKVFILEPPLQSCRFCFISQMSTV